MGDASIHPHRHTHTHSLSHTHTHKCTHRCALTNPGWRRFRPRFLVMSVVKYLASCSKRRKGTRGVWPRTSNRYRPCRGKLIHRCNVTAPNVCLVHNIRRNTLYSTFRRQPSNRGPHHPCPRHRGPRSAHSRGHTYPTNACGWVPRVMHRCLQGSRHQSRALPAGTREG